jgi:hypothetical protein
LLSRINTTSTNSPVNALAWQRDMGFNGVSTAYK